jgi:hypothetical protein
MQEKRFDYCKWNWDMVAYRNLLRIIFSLRVEGEAPERFCHNTIDRSKCQRAEEDSEQLRARRRKQ